MYITELQDRIAARQFLDRLQGSDESRIVPPVAGYLLFLTGELDRHMADLLFDSLEGLHEATGPYVAGFLFFKNLNVVGREQHGVNWYEKNQEYEFMITQMDRFRRRRNFERYAHERRLAGDFIANALSITEHLPCIVGLDVVTTPRMHSIHVTKFPEKAETLAQFVRGIVSDITDSKSRFHDFASGLETLERLENQYTKCSEAVKIRDRIKGILGKVSISHGSIREQLAKVVRSEVIPSDAALGALESLRFKTFPKKGFMNQMLQLSHHMHVELDPTWLKDASNIPTGNKNRQLYQAKFLERAIEILSSRMVTQRELDNLRIQMGEKGAEVSSFRQQLLAKEPPSLVKIVARNAKLNKLASLGEATLSAITDSISEVMKPSFILKLSSLIR